VFGQLAGGADGVVVMVAFVPHREELAAVGPNVPADRALYGRAWKRVTTPSGTPYKTDQIEESGQYEVVNWSDRRTWLDNQGQALAGEPRAGCVVRPARCDLGSRLGPAAVEAAQKARRLARPGQQRRNLPAGPR